MTAKKRSNKLQPADLTPKPARAPHQVHCAEIPEQDRAVSVSPVLSSQRSPQPEPKDALTDELRQ